jgi:hypothetical protein
VARIYSYEWVERDIPMKTRWTTIAGIVTALLLPQSSFAARHIQITTCPYTADVARAIYTVTQDVEGHGNCIDITAPGITVKVNGKIVSGGIGIYVESSAKNAHILGPGTVWGGIVDKGDSALIRDLALQGDIGFGLLIWGASGAIVEHNSVFGAMGIDLRASQKCKINRNRVLATSGGEYDPAYAISIGPAASKGQSKNNVISNNNLNGNHQGDLTTIGILVGNPPDEAGICQSAGKFPIEGTVIVNNLSSEHGGWNTPGIGIALGCKNDSAHSIVKNNTAIHNQNYDLYDGNPDCGTNTWEDNHFKTSNQGCIQ